MSSKQNLQLGEILTKSQDFIKNVTTVLNESNVVKSEANESVPPKSAECYQCNKTFPTFAEAVMHLKLIHNACAFKDCSRLTNFKLHSSACANRGLGCAICSRKFQEKHSLVMHFYEHIDAALYACEVCREGFQQRRDLQKHFFQIHNKFLSIPVTPSLNKTVYQKCQNCSKYFKLFAEFEEHMSTCTFSTYACYICKVSFSSMSALEEHKITEHNNNDQVLKGNQALKQGRRYFCGLCFLGFLKGGILKEHVMTHKIETKHICDVCHITFKSDGDLQAHYLQRIEEHYVLHDVISQHSCKHCKKTFKTLKELNDHMNYKNCKSSKNTKKLLARNNNDECLISDKENTADSNTPLVIPDIPVYVLKVGEDLLNCDDSECVIVMDLTSYYVLQRGTCASESRMPDVKNSEVYTESEYPETSSIENYMVSILTAYNDDSVNRAKIPDNIESPYLEKNDETDNVETIVLNINECNDGSMQCEFVGDDVAEKGEFEFLVYDESDNMVDLSSDSNKVTIHENKMTFDIEDYIQGQDNINKELLIENEDALDVSGLYICNICKQVFSSKNSLCLHMKGSHTGYDCYRCDNSFTSEEELKNHEKIHLNAFQCDSCEVSYPKETLLKKHKESAHGKTSFICNICNKIFASENEYDIHATLHVGKTLQCEECGKVSPNVSSFLKHKVTHENKNALKKSICTVCDKVFAEENSLKLHLATHTRKSPYNFECPKCKMYFPSKMLSKHACQ